MHQNLKKKCMYNFVAGNNDRQCLAFVDIRLNHNFCYTMTKNFKFIFLYLCLTSVNKICTIVINNVLPANREIIDALLVEVWRFLVEESLEAAFEVIVVFELPSVEEVAQRPE